MADGRITEKDLADKKIYEIGQKFADSLEPANIAMDELRESALAYGKIEKEFKLAPGRKEFLEIKAKEEILRIKTANAIKAEENAVIALERKKQSLITTEKKQLDLDNKKIIIQKKKTTLTAEERLELQRINRDKKEAAILSSALSTEYEKQSVRLIQLRRSYKDVALSEGETSKKAKELKIQIDKLDTSLKRVDGHVGQFQRNVGNYGSAMKSAGLAVRSLMSAMGLVGAAYLFIRVMRDAFNTIVEFDRQLIAVGKTTDLSKEDLKSFGSQVVTLGLQLEGISTKNLLKSAEVAGQLGIRGTRNILKFSATLEKLALTSNIAGQESARAFAKFIELSSDSVENADRLGSVITDLGNNFATTESEILKNTTEIQRGIAIYETSAHSVIALGAATSALGGQAEASRGALQKTFKVLNEGATSGKNLEKILKLTGQTAEEFKEEFGRDAVSVFNKFVKGLSESSKEGENLSNTLVGLGLAEKRTEAVVGSLAKNYNILEDALSRANTEYETNIALNTEYDAATESLRSHIDDLGDAWDNLVISVEDGDGAISTFFKNAIKGFTSFVGVLNRLNETETDKAQREYNEALQDGIDLQEQLLNDRKKLNKGLKEGDSSFVVLDDAAEEDLKNVQAQIKKTEDANDKYNESIQTSKDRLLEIADIVDRNATSAKGPNSLGALKEEEKILEAKVEAGEIDATNLGYLRGREEVLKRVLGLIVETNANGGGGGDAGNKDAKATFQLKKFQLEQEIKLDNELINNQKENIGSRIAAIQNANQKELELAELKRDFLLNQEGITTDGKKLILEKYTADVLQIEKNKQASVEVILKSSFDKAKKRIEDENKLQDKAYNDQVTALQESLQLGEITVKQYEDRLLKLKQEYSVKSIEAKIAQLEKELAAMLPFYDGYAELEQQLYNLRIALSDAETENYIDNVDKKAEAERKFEQFLRDQVTNASNVIARALNLDAGNINNLFSSLTDNIKVTTDEQGKLISKLEFDYTDALVTAGAATAVAGDISNAVFERNIANLDYQIEKNQEYYDTKIELATGDDELQRLLILESEQKRLELEAKKRKEQTKQFKFNKALAFNEAGIKTALAIVSALTTAPAPLGIALAAIVGALGTIQLIAIANSPIPKFKKGHLQGTHEGPAITNEERDEVWERDGVGSLIKGRNVPIMMKKGDKIHKSEKDYERYLRASILTSVDVNNQKLNSFQSTQILNINNEELLEEAKLNRKAIEKLKLNVSFNQTKSADFNQEFFKWQNRN